MSVKLLVFVLNLILFFSSSVPQRVASEEGNEFRTYIVHVKKPEIWLDSEGNNLHRWYESFLPSTTIIDTASLNTETRILHAYRHVGYAFAARLTKDEALDMANKHGVLMVRQENTLQLQTTHTPTFLGLNRDQGLWREPNLGKGVIIGVFDTGISPFHPSFNDEGMSAPPAKWRGKCHFKKGCNKKIIGAISTSRSTYMSAAEADPPFDVNGHGTHAASTIAGNFVKNANVLGHANGTSAGMAPHAHLAIYRVCNMVGHCSEGSVLAAFDAAIDDGVDIISVSLAGESKFFSQDAMSIGSFVATRKGILVTIAAGNEGPEPSTVVNEAPWMFTVGASTMDRRIVASTKLGNGVEYDGESLYNNNDPSNSMLLPLVHLHGVPCNNNGVLESLKVEGKIVVCVNDKNTPTYQQAEAVKSAGAAAMILANSNKIGYTISLSSGESYPLPVTHVSHASGLQIISYIDSSTDPKATILFKGTVTGYTGNTPAPVVASFSSRGPSRQCPGILKPDIIAPGVNVLASWSDWGTNNINGEGEPAFSIMSGTSMACPHISGIAALLKSSHPDWSPAAVKSAIMTTAHTTNLQGEPIPDEKLLPASLFAIGAGHVSPSKANDPGLVYDTVLHDYTAYLCGLGSTNTMIELVKDKPMNYCDQVIKRIEATELNYPSFSVVMGSDYSPKTYNRTVTNVGEADSRYVVRVVPPSGVDVSVEPQLLVFNAEQQTARYSVTFTRKRGETLNASSTAHGFLEWFSDKHFVTSPIAVIFTS
ncbi:hypothetical protein PIB30_004887 [Stylosanthes scabra]|uniref:Uncharacterized protein n=1 Tax=Stylosanthes scabra TaxID=79078 RepID=A0ABU6V262_9FABA|nr:hypothetical protein [Stylosanthes scabra]